MNCSDIINKINQLPTHIEIRKTEDEYLTCIFYGKKLGFQFYILEPLEDYIKNVHEDFELECDYHNDCLLVDDTYRERYNESELVQVFYNV